MVLSSQMRGPRGLGVNAGTRPSFTVNNQMSISNDTLGNEIRTQSPGNMDKIFKAA